jgi:hypothetical protein
MLRELFKRMNRENLSTKAEHRGGVIRSSDEGTVMVLERRYGIVQFDKENNRKREDSIKSNKIILYFQT